MDNYSKEINSAYFRELGWSQLRERWTPVLIVTIIYCIALSSISTALGTLNLGLIASIIIFPMLYSYNVAFLKNKRTGSDINIEALFVGYNDFSRISFTLLLEKIYIILWSMLLLIPGIIKSFSYSQTVYILYDNPELSYNSAIEHSMAMMEGHKMEYFTLILSFIGWIFLCIITFGIASLWVNPYMTATFAHYYEYVKAEYDKKRGVI